jgi:hypothetical protein
LIEAMARAADGKAFLVQELSDATDQQHLVVLVVAPIATPLHRLELGEFLLPITKHMRLDDTGAATSHRL